MNYNSMKATKVSREYKNISISRDTTKSAKRVAKKIKANWLIVVFVFITAVAGGYFAHKYVCKNDIYEMVSLNGKTDIILGGTESDAISEYEELGKEKTVEGRKIGSQLVQIYLKHDEEKQSLLLAETLIKFQKTDEEKILLAENSKVIANIYRKENKNKDSALLYLQAAENFRSNKDFSTQAAECLYSAVEAFVANGDEGDAKATAQLLIELYPQTRQAKRVNALIK